jgi:hypothetical protein
MEPIRTKESNFTYLGPTPRIADLPCHRDSSGCRAVFRFTDDERAMIAKGANLEIGIAAAPIPPLSVNVTGLKEVPPPTRDGLPVKPDFRCEKCRGLYVADRAQALGYDCGWCGGKLRVVFGDD